MKIGEILRTVKCIGSEIIGLPFSAISLQVPDFKDQLSTPRVQASPQGRWVNVEVDRTTGTIVVPEGVRASVHIGTHKVVLFDDTDRPYPHESGKVILDNSTNIKLNRTNTSEEFEIDGKKAMVKISFD